MAYTRDDFSSDILYQDSALSPIVFGPRRSLIAGKNNNVTSTKQNVTSDVVLIASGGRPLLAKSVHLTFPVASGAPSGGLVAAAFAERPAAAAGRLAALHSTAGFSRSPATPWVIIMDTRGVRWVHDFDAGMTRRGALGSAGDTPFGNLRELFA